MSGAVSRARAAAARRPAVGRRRVWASAAGAVEWRDVGWDADERAKAKHKSYEEAMERERQGQAGWFPELRLQSTDQFVPLAYEMNGTWGADADKFFRFVVECAEWLPAASVGGAGLFGQPLPNPSMRAA